MSTTDGGVLGIVSALTDIAAEHDLYHDPTPALDAIKTHYRLKACCFYSYSAVSNLCSLRAQVGLDYDDYVDFEVEAGERFREEAPNYAVKHVEDISVLPFCENKGVLSKFDLRAAIELPLATRADINQKRLIGVLLLYPEKGAAKIPEDMLYDVGCLFSRLYMHEIAEAKLLMREQIMEVAHGASDLSSFLHKICRLLHDKWNYDAASVYINDERAGILRLRATTGIDSDLPRHEMFIKANDEDSAFAAFMRERDDELFAGESCFLVTFSSIEMLNEKYPEITRLNRHSVLFVAIDERQSYSDGVRKIGILKVVNRLQNFNGRTVAITFGWEDLEVLDFFASVASVITSHYFRVSYALEHIERSLHGIQANLLAARSHLHFVLEFSTAARNIEPKFRHSIPDAIEYIDAVGWQLNRIAQKNEEKDPVIGEVNIYAEVLAKLPSVIRSYARIYGATYDQAKVRMSLGILKKMPTVRGNAELLTTVFRNLVENAIKYSKRGESLQIKVHATHEDESVRIQISDQGIGINKYDYPHIFSEGFRAEAAIRRHAGGRGLGLHQCREIMEQLGGKISLKKHRDPTVFEVSIPTWKEPV